MTDGDFQEWTAKAMIYIETMLLQDLQLTATYGGHLPTNTTLCRKKALKTGKDMPK